MRDRERSGGCPDGGVDGDALGYAGEFLREGQNFRRYGENGIAEYELPESEVQLSDEPQRMLFIGKYGDDPAWVRKYIA
ncbi:MAG: hypothetical protein IJ088_03930 [Clostridia bacterium]|nr:hypothetical protein [Clostridia bacterium]